MTTDPTAGPSESAAFFDERVAASLLHNAAFRAPVVVAATVIAIYDDGSTQVHSVARGTTRTKIIVDLSEDA